MDGRVVQGRSPTRPRRYRGTTTMSRFLPAGEGNSFLFGQNSPDIAACAEDSPKIRTRPGQDFLKRRGCRKHPQIGEASPPWRAELPPSAARHLRLL